MASRIGSFGMKDLLVVVRSVLLLRRAADQRLPVLITQSQRILCFRLSLFRSVRDGFADLWQESFKVRGRVRIGNFQVVQIRDRLVGIISTAFKRFPGV